MRRGRSRTGAPRVAALTVVRDEAAMLPRWVSYYGDQLGMENLLVVDDGSTDGSTDDLPCRVVRHGGFPDGQFEQARMELVSRLGARLLRDHDAVVFTDADELLLADPDRYDGLRDVVARRPELRVTAGIGVNVVHHVDLEPALDPGLPVLGQRRFAKVVGKLSKPSLKTVDAPWVRASHGVRAPYAVDRGLLLVHLKFADLGLLRRTADLRHVVHARSGLTERSAWAHDGDAMAAQLRSFVTGGADAPELDLDQIDTSRFVINEGDTWHAAGARQVRTMVEGPLVRLPVRFHTMV